MTTGTVAETASLVGAVRWLTRTTQSSEVDAAVVHVAVQEGDQFKAGDVLIKLDDRDGRIHLQEAEADWQKTLRVLDELKAGTRQEVTQRLEAEVRQQEAKLTQAQDVLQRTEKLSAEKVQTEAELVGARAARDEAQALLAQSQARHLEAKNGPRPEAIRVAEAQVEVARAAVEAAKRELEKCIVRGPFDGAVLRKFVDVGGYVRMGDALLEVAATDGREAFLEVPERYARYVRPGVEFSLRPDAFADAALAAKVAAVVPLADSRSRNLQVRATILNPPDALVAGMFVRGELPVVTRAQATLVPADAVTLRDDRPVVFTVADGKATEVPVTLGLSGDGVVEVVRPALEAGTNVVTTGGEILFSGASVQVAETGPSTLPEAGTTTGSATP